MEISGLLTSKWLNVQMGMAMRTIIWMLGKLVKFICKMILGFVELCLIRLIMKVIRRKHRFLCIRKVKKSLLLQDNLV